MSGQVYLTDEEITHIFHGLDVLELDSSDEQNEADCKLKDRIECKLFKIWDTTKKLPGDTQ